MNEDWVEKTIEQVCEILDNKRKPITKRDRIAGNIPYYGATGVLDYVEGYIFDEELILLGEDGAKWKSGDNSAFKIRGKTWVNNHAHVLRPIRDVIIDDWLVYNLNYQDLMPFVSGMTVPKLNQGNMKKVKIPIPPLPEQKRIVAILDEAFEAIDQAKANVEKNIQNAEELFQSKLNEIFSQSGEGWTEFKLKEITTKIGSGATPRGGKKSYKESGISLIRSMNVYDEGFKENKLAFIDEEQADKLSNVEILKGDVLLNITGASVARCCVVPEEYLPARVNQHVSIIRLKEDVMDERLLQFALIAKPNKEKLLGIGEQGSTRQAITKKQIQNYFISYPTDFNQQRKIIQILDNYRRTTNDLIEQYSSKFNSLEELKKSILQKAFSGELTAKETVAV